MKANIARTSFLHQLKDATDEVVEVGPWGMDPDERVRRILPGVPVPGMTAPCLSSSSASEDKGEEKAKKKKRKKIGELAVKLNCIHVDPKNRYKHGKVSAN